MKFLPGRLTFSQIVKAETGADNPGGVIVLAANTIVATLNLGSLGVGDRITLYCRISFTKGGVAGDVGFFIGNSGTAGLLFGAFASDVERSKNPVPAGETDGWLWTRPIKVTSAGTVILDLTGHSAGSNSTVNASAAHLFAQVIAGG